jgi:DNA-directed RNA polymerase specialized sigma24 family protein
MQTTFITLYDQYVDDIFRQCYRKTHNKEIAKNITHQIFTKTWDNVQTNSSEKEIKDLLFTITRNALIEHTQRLVPHSQLLMC